MPKTPVDAALDVWREAFDCLSAGGTISRRWDTEPELLRRHIMLSWPAPKED